MEKLTEFIVTKGNLNTVLWLSIALVMTFIYAFIFDKSIFYLMISAYVTCLTSFSNMGLASQLIVFLVLYLMMYLSLKFHIKQKKQSQKKE